MPQKSVLKAGSTILVPNISASAAGTDISADVIENAVMAVENERAGPKTQQLPSSILISRRIQACGQHGQSTRQA